MKPPFRLDCRLHLEADLIRVPGQEWTPTTVDDLARYGGYKGVADAHNAELAAANSQLDEAGSHNAVADRELRELRQQLAKLKEGK